MDLGHPASLVFDLQKAIFAYQIITLKPVFTRKINLMYTEPAHKPITGIASSSLLINLFKRYPALFKSLGQSGDYTTFLSGLKALSFTILSESKAATDYYEGNSTGSYMLSAIEWKYLAAIRLLDYIGNSGRSFEDLNLNKRVIINEPLKPLWEWVTMERKIAGEDYFTDMLHLFRQLTGEIRHYLPGRHKVEEWMNRHPSGLDERIVRLREANKKRILHIIIKRIDGGMVHSERYQFQPDMTFDEKYKLALQWWETSHFHLKFAVRTPELLNEMLDNSVPEEVMEIMALAKEKKIPIFVNPYYLSLLLVNPPADLVNSDLAIRDYVFMSRDLVEAYGSIEAWEKEDFVEPGKPNAAGWILPTYRNLHRRYPEVAILIPDTAGRACGGLCVSCQRMYEFQSGHLNFNIEKLLPKESWPDKLRNLLRYFEKDAQLRDILITGGDALMSRDISLKLILDEVYNMALRKKMANAFLPDGEKLAEMSRIRLGTRLPVYLPQRITPQLISILREFREKAEKIGFSQFVIQTHFESAMEITPESQLAVDALLSTGWIVTNQQVFISAASRRGHTARLRKALNDIGVLTYYTFSVKGFNENKHNFATNARTMQEMAEEKIIGRLPVSMRKPLAGLFADGSEMVQKISQVRRDAGIPFLATDRNVMNLPGVGKSLTFRTIGITNDGRRILEFDHDHGRRHSPIIQQMGKMVIIESKSVAAYLRQMKESGENVGEYETLYGYSIGVTEPVNLLFSYPKYDFEATGEITNLELILS